MAVKDKSTERAHVEEHANTKEPGTTTRTPPADLSRRRFLQGLAAAGIGVAVASQSMQFGQAQSPPFSAADLSEDDLVEMLRTMYQIRWYDRTVGDRQASDPEFRGYMHGSPGHEAVAVGACKALTNNDWVQGYHRSHHHSIAKGADIDRLAAEITYKATGTNRGYGGSMHLMQKDVGMLGEDGIVGPGGLIGAGAAFGLQARGEGNVAVTFGGDAHGTSPYFQCALHNAMKYKLPFIYIIEKNGYQISHPWNGEWWLDRVPNGRDSAQTYLESHVQIGQGYGVPSYEVDGMSVTEVYSVMKEAVDRARAGEGPTLIQANCYRFYDHFGTSGVTAGELGAFGLSYRSDREVQHWMSKDPITTFRRTLARWEVLDEEGANALEDEVRAQIERAFAFADESDVPDPRGGLDRVYRQGSVLPRQLPDAPLYVEGWNEGRPNPADFPEFALGPTEPSRVRVEASKLYEVENKKKIG